MIFPSIRYMVNPYAPAGLSHHTNLTNFLPTKFNVSTVRFFFNLNNCCLVSLKETKVRKTWFLRHFSSQVGRADAYNTDVLTLTVN